MTPAQTLDGHDGHADHRGQHTRHHDEDQFGIGDGEADDPLEREQFMALTPQHVQVDQGAHDEGRSDGGNDFVRATDVVSLEWTLQSRAFSDAQWEPGTAKHLCPSTRVWHVCERGVVIPSRAPAPPQGTQR